MIKNFIRCGIFGWCWEIILTGLGNLLSFRRVPFMGNTSLLMFPIYGAGALLTPLARRLRHRSIWLRGACYTLCIFIAEFLSGSFLKRRQLCPWDYSRARWNLNGVIRLDYAPAWFILGLSLEKLLTAQEKNPPSMHKKNGRP